MPSFDVGRYPDGADVNRGIVRVYGRFAPNGVGAIDNSLNKGIAFVAARTDVGKFTVGIAVRAFAVLHASFQAWDVAMAPKGFDVLDCAQAPNGAWLLTVQQHDMAVPAALELAAANAKTWISFEVVLQTVKP